MLKRLVRAISPANQLAKWQRHSASLAPEDVASFYRQLLGREPEDASVIQHHVRHGSVTNLLNTIISSDEYRLRLDRAKTFLHFNSMLDVHSIVSAHEDRSRQAKPGYVTNFLGVSTDCRFITGIGHLSGTVEGLPFPCNFHAEVSEWAAAMRAVDLARATFTVCELGAGFGCWMVNTAVAAKRRGLKVMAAGVEADEEHVNWMAQHCATNGITSGEYKAIRAIAGPYDGVALFPIPEDSSATYGLEPRFFNVEEDATEAMQDGKFAKLPLASPATIFDNLARVDLLHIDIQGGEADFVHAALPLLREKVAYIVIGTHSRAIEGRLISELRSADWELEIEKPCDFFLPGLTTHQDGVQGWRNPSLT